MCGRINAKSSACAEQRRTENVVLKANQDAYSGRWQSRPLMPPSKPHLETPADSGVRISSIALDGLELSEPVKDQETGVSEKLGAIQASINELHVKFDTLVQARMVKEWYTTAEVAEILNKSHFTVRQWCNNKRIHAKKRDCGRGNSGEWMIAHEELVRIQNQGLLPLPKD
jgi:hypothetical protein